MKIGVTLHSFATISEVCKVLLTKGVIEEAQFNQIKKQITEPS